MRKNNNETFVSFSGWRNRFLHKFFTITWFSVIFQIKTCEIILYVNDMSKSFMAKAQNLQLKKNISDILIAVIAQAIAKYVQMMQICFVLIQHTLSLHI